MATWKKVITSGSIAELSAVSSSTFFVQGGQILTSPGSTFITGSFSGSFSGPLTGTATTASYVNGNIFTGNNLATSASYAITSSYATGGSVTTAATASYIDAANVGGPGTLSNGVLPSQINVTGVTASFLGNVKGTADTASYVNGNIFTSANPVLSASYATTSSFASSVNNNSLPTQINVTGVTASFLGNLTGTADTASYVNGNIFTGNNVATSASYAATASYALNTNAGAYVTTSSFNSFTSSINSFTSSINSFTSSYNTGSFTGSFVGQLTGTASWATNAVSASYISTLRAAGSDTQVQINTGGTLGASANFTFDYGISALAHGNSVTASGQYSHAEGNYTQAQGDYSHAEGSNTVAFGLQSHAEGVATSASGDFSHAEGDGTIALGDRSHAEGDSTIAKGIASHAEGQSGTAYGDYSHTEGIGNVASGSGAHAEGYSTDATGDWSHAEGRDTTALGQADHAEGINTIAQGGYSHAEGDSTTASGPSSHAEGFSTKAQGGYSHAEGSGSIAVGTAAHAEGIYTIASGSGQTVVGKYNVRGNTTDLFVVGGGTNDANRKDIFAVSTAGAVISGSLNVTAGITGSLTGSFIGSVTGTASNATSASYALTASYIVAPTLANNLTQGTGIVSFTYNGSSPATVAVSGASALSSNTVTKWTGNAFANTNITDNGSTVSIGVNKVTIDVATGNTSIAGDLTVAGTASFINTQNLLVADKYILLASGSTSNTNGGIIIQNNTNGSGFAYFLDANPTAPRWGYSSSVASNENTNISAIEYVNSTLITGSTWTATSAAPTYGGSLKGQGNMVVDGNFDIWIYV